MNIIKKVITLPRMIRDSMKESLREKENQETISSFYLSEKNGSVYLVHRGIAIAKLPDTSSMQSAVERLTETRKVAVEYNELFH